MSLNPSLSTIFQFQRLFSFFGGSEGWGGRKGPRNGFQMLISPRDKGAEPPRWCLAGDPGGGAESPRARAGSALPHSLRVWGPRAPHTCPSLCPQPQPSLLWPHVTSRSQRKCCGHGVLPLLCFPGCLFPDLRCHTVFSFWPSQQPLGAPNPAGWSPTPTLLRHSPTSGPLCPDLAGAPVPQTVCAPGCL